MNVLKVAEKTSDDLWSNMIRRQRETPEKINPNPEQWLADEVHTLLYDIRTNHYGEADHLREYERVVGLAKDDKYPEENREDQWRLDFAKDAVKQYQNLLCLEAELQEKGYTGTNLNPRKYRVSYDRVFLAHPPFEYNGDLITGASLDLTVQCFKDGKEVLFGENEGTSEEGTFHCSVNKEHGFLVEQKPYEESWFDSINCKAVCFFLDYYEGRVGDLYEDWPKATANMPCSGSKPTTKEEFIKVIQDHWENFDNSDNRHAQSCAWCHHEVTISQDTL